MSEQIIEICPLMLAAPSFRNKSRLVAIVEDDKPARFALQYQENSDCH